MTPPSESQVSVRVPFARGVADVSPRSIAEVDAADDDSLWLLSVTEAAVETAHVSTSANNPASAAVPDDELSPIIVRKRFTSAAYSLVIRISLP